MAYLSSPSEPVILAEILLDEAKFLSPVDIQFYVLNGGKRQSMFHREMSLKWKY